jgi:acyl-CoA reductase-like NAD-dependent aldehyde dehydrogenase
MIHFTRRGFTAAIKTTLNKTVNVPNQLLIGGKWLDAADKRTFDTIDPSTGEVITQVASAGAKDIDLAVDAAIEARKEWSKVTPA